MPCRALRSSPAQNTFGTALASTTARADSSAAACRKAPTTASIILRLSALTGGRASVIRAMRFETSYRTKSSDMFCSHLFCGHLVTSAASEVLRRLSAGPARRLVHDPAADHSHQRGGL